MNKTINNKIALVNIGDNEACREIIEEFKLMIYSFINKYDLEYGDYLVDKEDLFQEGCIALIDACRTFKDNNTTKFSTYAYIIIERRIQRVFFKSIRRYQKEFSYDKYEHNDHYNFVKEDKVKYEFDPRLLNNVNLTSEDKKIITLRLKCYSYKEIASMLNITCKRVDNRLSRIKKIYREMQSNIIK